MRNPARDQTSRYGSVVIAILALVSVALYPDVPFRNQDGRLRIWRPRVYHIALQPDDPLDGNFVWVDWVSESSSISGHSELIGRR